MVNMLEDLTVCIWIPKMAAVKLQSRSLPLEIFKGFLVDHISYGVLKTLPVIGLGKEKRIMTMTITA